MLFCFCMNFYLQSLKVYFLCFSVTMFYVGLTRVFSVVSLKVQLSNGDGVLLIES